MVPVLSMLFVGMRFEDSHLMHLALGTSMASIVVTSLSSMLSHHRHGAVLWPVVRQMAVGILLGTFAASYLVSYLSAKFLSILFTLFISYVAIQMFLNINPSRGVRCPSV